MPKGMLVLRSASFFGGLLLSFLLVPFLQGCGTEGHLTSLEGSSTVTLHFEGLQSLPVGMNYQAWLMAGTRANPWGVPVTLFNVNETGEMVDPVADTVLTGPFPAGIDAQAVFGVAVSLEATESLQSYSSFSFILGGDVVGGTASLSTTHWISFNASLTEATGRLILRTPTDNDPGNETSGVWFMDPTVTPTQRGLDLPQAPPGWNYESWVVLGDQPLSMGKFTLPIGPDSSSTYSGTLSAPDFPGEDFLTAAPSGLGFPVDLSGATVLVTMEPWAQWDLDRGAPFFLELFEIQLPADATPETPLDMTSRVNGLPTGTATIQGF